jgi:CDP-diacylglycerol---glycerol-3-phosphate 3-phosphatidyltransferase
MGVPNTLTCLRVCLIPIFILLFYVEFPGNRLLCASIFALAGATDWLDGYLARRTNQISAFGTFLDPVADKLVVATALILLVGEYNAIGVTLSAAIIIGREIVISALREWMAELGKRTSVAVSVVGKVKTFGQMLALTGLVAYKPGKWPWLENASLILLYLATALTLWTMIMYLKAAWSDLTLGAKGE